MKILTRVAVQIGKKTFKPQTTLTVTDDVAEDLIKKGKVYAVDGTFDVAKIVYQPEPAEKKKSTKNKPKKI